MLINYNNWIGKKVWKKGQIKNQEHNPKPFKSGLKINTVKGIINHPYLNVPAFTFEEDDSYVACATCLLVDDF